MTTEGACLTTPAHRAELASQGHRGSKRKGSAIKTHLENLSFRSRSRRRNLRRHAASAHNHLVDQWTKRYPSRGPSHTQPWTNRCPSRERNDTPAVDETIPGGPSDTPAAERRNSLAQRVSAGKKKVKKIESALADDTSFVIRWLSDDVILQASLGMPPIFLPDPATELAGYLQPFLRNLSHIPPALWEPVDGFAIS